MGDQTGSLIGMSVMGLGLGSLAWKYRKTFLAEFHANYLKEVEKRVRWALGFARLIVWGQRLIIHLAAVIWLFFGSVATLQLLLQFVGVDVLAILFG